MTTKPTPKGRTLLTADAPSTPEEWAHLAKRQARALGAEEAASLLLGELVNAYTKGELSFSRAVHYCCGVASAKELPEFMGQKLLGAAIQAITKAAPPRGAKGQKRHPTALGVICLALVDKVREVEGLPISRGAASGRLTAFARVADILRDHGLPLTPAQVEKYRDAELARRKRKNGGLLA